MNMRSLAVFQLVSLFAALAAAQEAAPASQPASQPAAKASRPMEITLQMIGDERRAYVGDAYPAEERLPTRFVLTFLLTGDRVGEIVRLSEPIITEMVDEQGRELVDANRYAGALRADPKPVEVPPMYTSAGMVPIQVQMPLFPRDAQKIARLKGYVNVVYGTGERRAYVDQLPRFYGKEIQHPELDAMGVRAVLLPPEEVRRAEGASFGLIFLEGEQKVKLVNGYDAWWRMLALRSQIGPGEVRGSPYRVYRPMRSAFSRDSELLFILHEYLEDDRLPFEFIDIELP